eukprot:744722-Rhodomonas_salina.1
MALQGCTRPGVSGPAYPGTVLPTRVPVPGYPGRNSYPGYPGIEYPGADDAPCFTSNGTHPVLHAKFGMCKKPHVGRPMCAH